MVHESPPGPPPDAKVACSDVGSEQTLRYLESRYQIKIVLSEFLKGAAIGILGT
jgi:hypothetical protein